METKIIETSDCFLKAIINSNGWVTIVDDNNVEISLGHYPNKRFDIIRKAIEYTTRRHNPNYDVPKQEGESQ